MHVKTRNMAKNGIAYCYGPHPVKLAVLTYLALLQIVTWQANTVAKPH